NAVLVVVADHITAGVILPADDVIGGPALDVDAISAVAQIATHGIRADEVVPEDVPGRPATGDQYAVRAVETNDVAGRIAMAIYSPDRVSGRPVPDQHAIAGVA